MADTKHTIEPWLLSWGYDNTGTPVYRHEGGDGIDVETGNANAGRLMACLAACVGMEDPMREIPHLLHTQELAREQREKAAEWGGAAYNAEVERMAAEIHEHLPDPSEDHNDRVDSVTESVDGSGWVMHAPDRVLEHSEQPQDSQEAAAMAGPDADWEKVRTVAAYLVMQQDVYEALSGLDDDAEQRLDKSDEAVTS